MNASTAIIPRPASLRCTGSVIHVQQPVPLYLLGDRSEVRGIADLFCGTQRLCSSPVFELMDSIPSNRGRLGVHLAVDSKNPEAAGSYRLYIDQTGIHISASCSQGLFYGLQTLCQLFPVDATSSDTLRFPTLEINDSPRFAWRGMHLDVSRHFFPVEFIKKYIDGLAFHKMNVFHWHLTDDQGWRIEIERFPRLTEVGAWRIETDGQRYGGYYSRTDIKDIVEYATARFVTIVPEIELPGHASAALTAYPEYSCTGGPFKVEDTWGIFDDVYCVGNERTFTFLEDILSEVAALFPGQYIHIGGDECPKVRWRNHDLCQRRKQELSLADEDDLQSYFVSRIARHLASLGKRLIGWDEILDGGAPPGATIMAWRNIEKGVEAARAGHDVIMSPMSHCYFDHYQGKTNEPKAIGGYTPLSSVYAFEPVPQGLPAELAQRVIGAQGNVWTEYMLDGAHVEYMTFPRLCALSEVLWSPSKLRSLPDFLERLKPQLHRLEARGVNYRRISD